MGSPRPPLCGADLLVLTGDYVWGGRGPGRITTEQFRPLEARYGVFAVVGNHDYWSGRLHDIQSKLTAAGIQVLVNQSAPLEVHGTRWWIGGVDDVWSGAPDLARTFVGVPAEAFKILLCHEPDFADETAAAGLPCSSPGTPTVARCGCP